MIVTDLCVFSRKDHGNPFRLIELAPGVTVDEIAARTTASYVALVSKRSPILVRESFFDA